MKKLVFILSLFITFSCNAQLLNGVNNQNKKRKSTSIIIPPAPPSPNMAVEDDYLNAYPLPIENAADLQSALNTYGAVKLVDDGDYTASGNITMTSNQRLYGRLSHRGTKIGGNITIAAGSSNGRIVSMDVTSFIIFEPGAPITGWTIESIHSSSHTISGANVENCTFINLAGSGMQINNSVSGYFRNNIIIKPYAQSANFHIRLLGNTTTPSYGNIELSRNFLTSGGSASEYKGLVNHIMVSTDAENCNVSGTGNAAYHFVDIGDLYISNMMGGNFAAGAQSYDIQANNLRMDRVTIQSNISPVIRSGSNVFSVETPSGGNDATLESGVFSLMSHKGNSTVSLNGVTVSAEITGEDATTLTNMLLPTPKTPWVNPEIIELPNPTGENWATERIGKTDSTAYIQGLIDANGTAELPEGIFYIGSTIYLTNDQGIIGAGTGKTAIVGLTDGFPLITAQDTMTSGGVTGISYTLAHLTLQGGHTGIKVDPIGKELYGLQMTHTAWRHVIFRDQTYGIHLDQFYAMDNNFFYNLNFVNCGIGFYQDPLSPDPNGGTGEYAQNMYVDKTIFYGCRFINCGVALDMYADGRANNLNGWINCVFDGNGLVLNTTSSNGLYIANSVFKNNSGTSLTTGGSRISYYNNTFENNTVTSLFGSMRIHAEGNNFNDPVPFFSASSGCYAYLTNNTITSTLSASQVLKGVLINNTFAGNAALSKLMINIASGTPTTILGAVATPYPQLLVK